jgi:hypothetical protein
MMETSVIWDITKSTNISEEHVASGIVAQKIELFITTTVRTSNPKCI